MRFRARFEPGRWTPLSLMAAVALVASLASRPLAADQTSSTLASQPPDIQRLNDALARADDLVRDDAHEAANALLETALETARASGLEPQEAQALLLLAWVRHGQSRYQESRSVGLEALALFTKLGLPRGTARANLVLGATAEIMGDQNEARTRLTAAVEQFTAAEDWGARGNALLRLSRTTSSPADRRNLAEQALDDARRVGSRPLEAAALHSLGDGHFSRGEYEKSFEVLQQAAALMDNPVDLGTIYNSIGRLFRVHGLLETALEYQQKALAVHERSGSTFFLTQSLNAVATVLGLLDRVDEAVAYQQRAIREATAPGSSSPRVLDFLNANLAGLLMQRGDYAGGAPVLEGVVARGLDAFLTERLGQLAWAYLKLGRNDDALATIDKSVASCSAPGSCMLARYRRAEVLAARGDVDPALTDLREAMALVEQQRAKLVPIDFFRLQYSTTIQGIYSLAAVLHLRQGNAGEALATTELARARAFVDLLASRDLRPDAQTAAATTSGDVLRAPVEGPARAIASPVTAPVAPSALAEAAARLDSTLLVYWLRDDEILMWTVSPDGAVQVARRAVPAHQLTALVRRSSPFRDASPRAASRQITTRGENPIVVDGGDLQVWRDLYDLLVQPVRRFLPTTAGAPLVIVPHGVLSSVSFAALKSPSGRYLVEDYTLSQVPAGSVLASTSSFRRSGARTGSMLVLADAPAARRSRLDPELPRLPGARAEAEAIAQLVRGPRLSRLEGEAAVESALRAQIAQSTVVHVATHAIVRDADPFESYIALASEAPASLPGSEGAAAGSVLPVGGAAATHEASAADGRLTAREIYDLRLNADLVVLTACRSGASTVRGDGIAALARAFIHAGTPSLIVSLWDVPDDPTPALLARFYREWLSGRSKAAALRTAQLATLAQLRAGRVTATTPLGVVTLPEHPVFWAGFALIGEPD